MPFELPRLLSCKVPYVVASKNAGEETADRTLIDTCNGLGGLAGLHIKFERS